MLTSENSAQTMTLHPLVLKGLTPELLRQAQEEVGETPEVKAKSIEQLKRLIKENADFVCWMDDSFLVRFLRFAKYDVQKAFKTIRNYYTFKAKFAGQYTNFKPSEVKHILEKNHILVSPYRDPHGGSIFILALGSFDADLVPMKELMAAIMVCSEVAICDETIQLCGSTVIFDFQGSSMRKLLHFASFQLLSFAFTGLQFHVHGKNLKNFHKYIPPENLPEELGGKLGPMDTTEYRIHILSGESYMEKLNRYGYEEQNTTSKSL
ncbi:alpha-tocopherol transfer protein-like isoform X2 [Stegodyphus dumicola]|uniref:alpha-tocopherol transfer protein-like isoform X2 n=1 Tax=Stegodyphus dumicola TaxID=202533 RepID=UPI0015B3004E|nr:alpha-tocopherol transfer protein-like isoform X2 [Stegodyphus dumicola]